jgi:hypothetical protein
VDEISFADFEIQRILADHGNRLLHKKVELRWETNRYYIYYNGRKIGACCSEMQDKLKTAVNTPDIRIAVPNRLTDVYISNVVTICYTHADERIPEHFKKSRFWLGIEISGLATPV